MYDRTTVNIPYFLTVHLILYPLFYTFYFISFKNALFYTFYFISFKKTLYPRYTSYTQIYLSLRMVHAWTELPHHYHNTHCFICHDVGDGSTAALVDLSKFCSLKSNMIVAKYISYFRNILCVSIICSILSTASWYLFNTSPLPKYTVFFFSNTSG